MHPCACTSLRALLPCSWLLYQCPPVCRSSSGLKGNSEHDILHAPEAVTWAMLSSYTGAARIQQMHPTDKATTHQSLKVHAHQPQLYAWAGP